jgi:hypothetical protein
MAGYTGRNRDIVLAHIEELARHGIPAPDSVPAYYAVPWQLLCFCEEPVEAGSDQTSGEVEPVLLITDRGTFVTVGSDHTDRAAERQSIVLSKRLAPKIVARSVWRLDDVSHHWDQLTLRSWVDDAAPYQEGTAQRILPLGEFPLAHLRPSGRDLVLFLGTLPLLNGSFVMSRQFRGELVDPVLQRTIGFSYTVQRLPEGGSAHAIR